MLTLILPFHGDADRLQKTLVEVEKFRAGRPGLIEEVILAHNGPGKPQILHLPPGIRVAHTDTPGIGAGYALGISMATQKWCVLSASDLPFGFSDIESAIEDDWKADIYVGSKLHPASNSKAHGKKRLLLSKIFHLWRRLVLAYSLPKDTQGTILVPTNTARKLLERTPSRDFFFSTEYLHVAAKSGLKIKEIPIQQLPDDGKSSVRALRDGPILFLRTLGLRLDPRTIRLAVAFGALTCLSTLPFYASLWLPNRILATRDLMKSFLPAKFFEWNSWLTYGSIPRWNPLVGGGVEFRDDLSTGPLYFLNLIFPIFGKAGFFQAFSWHIALHLPLAFISAWFFLRSYRLRRNVALLFAFLYSVSTFLVSSANSLNILAALTALPLYFGCLRNFVFERRFRSGLLAAISLAWPVYAGAPDFALFAGFCSPFLFFRSWKKPDCFVKLSLVGAAAVALALPIILPFREILLRSERASLTVKQSMEVSFHPLRLFEIFFPELWGNFVPQVTYVGKDLNESFMDFPLIINCYLGFFVPALLYIALAGRVKRRLPVIGAFLLALLLALGSRGFLYGFLSEHFSAWRTFRYPEKWIGIAALPLLLLSAMGMQRILAMARRGKLRSALPGLLILPILLAAIATFLLHERLTFPSSLLRYALFQFLLLLLFLLSVRKKISLQTFFALVFLVFSADQISNSVNYAWDQPLAVLENPSAEEIQKDIAKRSTEIRGGGAYRLYAKGDFLDLNGNFVPPELDFIGRTAWTSAKNFVPNSTMIYGLSDVSGYFGTRSEEQRRWWNNLAESAGLRLLDLMGAYYIVKRPPEIGFTRNPNALPFLALIRSAERMTDFEQTLRRLRDVSWDPKQTVLIEASEIPPHSEQTIPLEVERGLDRITIKTSPAHSEVSSLLLVNESFHSRWKCEPDCEVLGRANGWSLAVLVKRWSANGISLRFR